MKRIALWLTVKLIGISISIMAFDLLAHYIGLLAALKLLFTKPDDVN